MDRLEAMSLLVAVAEAGSLSAAGRKLGVPLPTVSRKISELEAHLNARLLIRSTRKLALTEQGAAYVAAAKRILDEVSEAERAASGEHASPRGDLVITAPIVFGRLHVLPVIAEFLTQWPEINVRLVLSDRNLHLIDDHVDIALRIGALADSALVCDPGRRGAPCGVRQSRLFRRARRPETAGGSRRPERGHLRSSFRPPEHWIFRDPKSKREIRVPVRSRLSVNTAEAAIDGAAAGVGVTRVLSYQAAQAVLDRRIEIVLAEYEPEPSPVSLIHGQQELTPLKVRMLLDFAAPRLRARLA